MFDTLGYKLPFMDSWMLGILFVCVLAWSLLPIVPTGQSCEKCDETREYSKIWWSPGFEKWRPTSDGEGWGTGHDQSYITYSWQRQHLSTPNISWWNAVPLCAFLLCGQQGAVLVIISKVLKYCYLVWWPRVTITDEAAKVCQNSRTRFVGQCCWICSAMLSPC